jgi:hypothetical protein
MYTRADLELDTLQKLRSRSGIRIGAQQIGHTSYTGGRLLAYFLHIKDPKSIAGQSSRELDAASIRGELDARANNLVSALRRNPDWPEKSLTNWDGILEAPLAIKLPRL